VIILTDAALYAWRSRSNPSPIFRPFGRSVLTEAIEGPPLPPVRRARSFHDDEAELVVIERHGYAGF